MKKKSSLSFLLFAIFSFSSCVAPTSSDREPTGVIQSKTFIPSEFDGIEYGSAFEVEIKQGSSYKVTATGDETDIADLNVEVIGGTLNVNYSNSDFFSQSSRSKMQIVIETTNLSLLDLSGASQTKVSGFGSLESLSVGVSGASKLGVDVPVRSLELDISGASIVTFNQDIGTLQGEISGASNLKSNEKSVLKVVLDLSGASSADLNVEDELEVEVSGASTVRYTGDPKVKEETSGAGRVIKQ